MTNCQHNIQVEVTSNLRNYHGKIYYGNNGMETIRNLLIKKNKAQMHNSRRNTGALKNSKHSLKCSFTF